MDLVSAEIVEKLNRYLIKIDSSIETHPFRPEDFSRDNFFVDQIVKEGDSPRHHCKTLSFSTLRRF